MQANNHLVTGTLKEREGSAVLYHNDDVVGTAFVFGENKSGAIEDMKLAIKAGLLIQSICAINVMLEEKRFVKEEVGDIIEKAKNQEEKIKKDLESNIA